MREQLAVEYKRLIDKLNPVVSKHMSVNDILTIYSEEQLLTYIKELKNEVRDENDERLKEIDEIECKIDVLLTKKAKEIGDFIRLYIADSSWGVKINASSNRITSPNGVTYTIGIKQSTEWFRPGTNIVLYCKYEENYPIEMIYSDGKFDLEDPNVPNKSYLRAISNVANNGVFHTLIKNTTKVIQEFVVPLQKRIVELEFARLCETI